MKKMIILLVVASMLSVKAVRAQTPDPDTTARHFLIMASIGNLQEVSAGKLAVQKATASDVKSFGEMMINDHSSGEKELLQVAKAGEIQLPAAATGTPPNDLNLSKASGDEFDRIYIHSMLSGHRNTVMMFQNYAVTGKDMQVRAFARRMLPTLKQHLAAIKSLDEKYKYLAAK